MTPFIHLFSQGELRRQGMRSELREAGAAEAAETAHGSRGGATGMEALVCVISLLAEVSGMEEGSENKTAQPDENRTALPASPGGVGRRLAQVEEDRARLIAEVAELKLRLSETRSGAVPPPPPSVLWAPPPPPPSQDNAALQLKDDVTKRFSSFATKFRSHKAK